MVLCTYNFMLYVVSGGSSKKIYMYEDMSVCVYVSMSLCVWTTCMAYDIQYGLMDLCVYEM